MKKEYISPKAKLIELESVSHLMANSIPIGGDSEGGVTDSRRGDWYDDEDEDEDY